MTPSVTVGLIASPELATDLAGRIVEELPNFLKQEIDKNIEWTVETVVDPLTGAAETVHEIFQKASSYKEGKSWDYIVCVTDLPVFHEENIVALDINESLRMSIVSIPAFGWTSLRKKINQTVVYACKEMHQLESRSGEIEKKKDNEKSEILSSTVLRKELPISPIRKVRLWMEETGNVHTRFLAQSQARGKARLLVGMTRANNPLQMMSSLTNVVAIAFATGAFGMVFTTMWELSHLFSKWRMSAMTVAAIVGMVGWVIIAQELLEPHSTRTRKRIRKLYNKTTVLTLFISITAYYIVVFLLFFITTLVLIPPDFLGETLDMDTSVTLVDYVKISWFSTSISIFVGAIGAGLENEELVRESTYGYRQIKRYESMREDQGN